MLCSLLFEVMAHHLADFFVSRVERQSRLEAHFWTILDLRLVLSFFPFERSYNEIANWLHGRYFHAINKSSAPFKIGHYDTRKVTTFHYYLTHISRRLWPMLFLCIEITFKMQSFSWLFCQPCRATKQVGGPFFYKSGSSTCSVFFFER